MVEGFRAAELRVTLGWQRRWGILSKPGAWMVAQELLEVVLVVQVGWTERLKVHRWEAEGVAWTLRPG